MGDSIKGLLLVLVQLACLAWIAASGRLIATSLPLLLLEAAAGLLGVWALLTMGPRNFNVAPLVRRGAQLVARGPYRWIRHPMYTALLLGAGVLVLSAPSGHRLLAWGILLVTLLIKLAFEERLLARSFEAYEEYRRRTKRLIPFVF